jgi:hypothetical protein
MTSRGTLIGIAIVASIAGNLLPPSNFSVVLRYVAVGVILIDMLLTAREGYRRRRPYWTADSWRRYLAACAVPVGALVILACMLAALDYRHPWVGAARSTTRAIWAAIMTVLIVIGGGGLAIAVQWLALGDPTRQFNWPRLQARSPSAP